MRRPFALIGFSYLGALLAAVFLQNQVCLGLGCFFLFLSILLFCKKSFHVKPAMPLVVLITGIAFVVYSCAYGVKIAPTEGLDGKDVTVSGVVTELPEEAYHRFYYVIETDAVSLENAPQNLKIRVSSTNYIELSPFDRLTAKVHLTLPFGEEEGLNTRNYNAAKGVYLTGFVYDYEEYQVESAQSRPLYYYALMTRKALTDALHSLLSPKQSGLVCGVLLGDKSGLSETVRDDFRTCGVSHLLAVSGLHMAIISQFFLWLLLLLGLPRRAAAPLSALGVLAFMAVTGFVPSVVRAGIMSILYLLGIGIRQKSDPLNSLGLATLVLTVPNPFAAGDVGFLLSFSATLGLLLLSSRIQRFFHAGTDQIGVLKHFFRSLNGILATTVAATIFTTPIVAMTFGEVSLIAPVANVLMTVPATGMLLFGFLASLLFYAGPLSFISMPMALGAGVLANYLEDCAAWLSSCPFASIPASQSVILGAAICFAVVAVFLVLFKGQGFALKLVACLVCFCLLCGIFGYQARNNGVIEIGVLNTGSGSSVVITQNGRGAVLCSGGGNGAYAKLQNYLDQRGIKVLDYLLISQVDQKTSSGAGNLIRSYDPRYVLASSQKEPQDRLRRALKNRAGVAYFSEENETKLWDEISIHTIAFKNDSWILLEIGKEKFLICPSGGDAGDLSQEQRDCNFYIAGEVPEHAEAICADYGIFTMYQEDALEAKEVHQSMQEQYITTKQGTVSIFIHQDGVNVQTGR